MEHLNLAPAVLEWAADQVGETLEGVAASLAKRRTAQEAIESGRLTPKQAEKFAEKTRVPFGYLFLPHPPKSIRPSIPDLRQSANPDQLSADFYEVLEDAIRKQLWFKEHLARHGAEAPGFVGRAKGSQNVTKIAAEITAALKLSPSVRSQCPGPDAYFSFLAGRVEELGVLVLKSGIVRSNTRRPLSFMEFRGFALADAVAPLIFINGRDWQVAWVFTLMHELSHIWLGVSGVSDQARENNSQVETICNAVAAEVLVPRDEFLAKFEEVDDLTVVARHFRVSRLVVARRAFDLALISRTQYQTVASESAGAKKQGEGGNPWRTIPVRNSKRLTLALVNSAMSGTTLIREAASLLAVKPDTVAKLSRELAKSG